MYIKRSHLLEAITHNVKYIAIVNESNSAELRRTKERLVVVQDWNDRLQDENNVLTERCLLLEKDQ